MTLPAKPATQDPSLAVHQSGFRPVTRQRPLTPPEQLLAVLIDRLRFVKILTDEKMSQYLTPHTIGAAAAEQPALMRTILGHCSPIPHEAIQDEKRESFHQLLLRLALTDPESELKLPDLFEEIPCEAWARAIDPSRLWSMILATHWWESSGSVTASVCSATIQSIIEYGILDIQSLTILLGGVQELQQRHARTSSSQAIPAQLSTSFICGLYEPDEIHFRLLRPLAVQFQWIDALYNSEEIPTSPSIPRIKLGGIEGFVTDPDRS